MLCNLTKHGVAELWKNITSNMQPRLLKGSNASYFFFPLEETTIISRNKFSVVYIAAELNTKTKVICRQLLPALYHHHTAKLKFFIEASIKLKHPGIVKTIDLIVEESEIFIIQEFVQGFTLSELIANREYYDYRYNPFFYKIIAECLDALSFIHDQKLCLCDIKPSNIMIVNKDDNMDINNPRIKIIDLSSLKPSFQIGALEGGGKSFNIMYASPEQVFGFSELVGDHSDIFSMGIILYEAIAKEPALNTSNPMFIKRFQSVVKIEKHYRFDDELFNVISKATVKPELIKASKEYTADEIKILIIKSLGQRYQSTTDFRNDLLSLIN